MYKSYTNEIMLHDSTTSDTLWIVYPRHSDELIFHAQNEDDVLDLRDIIYDESDESDISDLIENKRDLSLFLITIFKERTQEILKDMIRKELDLKYFSKKIEMDTYKELIKEMDSDSWKVVEDEIDHKMRFLQITGKTSSLAGMSKSFRDVVTFEITEDTAFLIIREIAGDNNA